MRRAVGVVAGGGLDELGEAEEEEAGLAGVFAMAARLGGERLRLVLVFVGEVLVDDAVEQTRDAGEKVGGDETRSPRDGGLDVVKTAGDVGARHPEGDRLECGLVLVGDLTQRVVG